MSVDLEMVNKSPTVLCFVSNSQGLMHLQGKPVCSFDPEGLIFAAGINSEMVKLYDLRSFDKVRSQKPKRKQVQLFFVSGLKTKFLPPSPN